MNDETTMAELEAALRGWDLQLELNLDGGPMWIATLRHSHYKLVFCTMARTLSEVVNKALELRDAS